MGKKLRFANILETILEKKKYSNVFIEISVQPGPVPMAYSDVRRWNRAFGAGL